MKLLPHSPTWLSRLAATALTLVVVLAGGGCEIDTIPTGLRETPPGSGPLVRFDPARTDLPLPNDVASFADPTSRTGRRPNLSVAARASLDRALREDLASLEGWGVSAPITVGFERVASGDPAEPAIDLAAVVARMVGDEHDPSNDPFYVVNLATGIPVILDVGAGYTPTTLRDTAGRIPGDPKASEPSLVFETVEEARGLPQAAYRPELDRDFDGVLDHPNTLPGGASFLDWYERETDTLVLRPVVPLDEKTEYAVVLTDRLRGPNGEPVRSPFAAIHHPTQLAGLTRLQDWLRSERLAAYYGDIAGTGLDHVAFVWTFTTQPTHEDFRLLRDGLYGRGPFAKLAEAYPPAVRVGRFAGTTPANQDQPAGWETSTETCKARARTPFALRLDERDVRDALQLVFSRVFALSAGAVESAIASLDAIDHVVVGSYEAPYLLGDPSAPDPSDHFRVDFRNGSGQIRRDAIQWVLVVPKAAGDRKPPFPIAVWGHGSGSNALEALLFGGDYARQGIALLGYNLPGHGLVLGEQERALADVLLLGNCVAPFLDSVANGRARDIDGDGRLDSGGLFWSARAARSRDSVRQGVLDAVRLIQNFRAFDGRKGLDGRLDAVGGDFDGDGIPDAGGPNVPYFATGRSLGGITAQILGAIEPHVIASAPISGGGGLAVDVAMRGAGPGELVLRPVLGPFVLAVPAAERTNKDATELVASRCGPGQRTVRLQVDGGVALKELELACLDPAELEANMTVVVTNVGSKETRCTRTGPDGRFSIPIATNRGDRLDVQVYRAPDVVDSYATCRVLKGSPVGRRVQTFEQAAVTGFPVANPDRDRCTVPEGCQQFQNRFFAVGEPLVAPSDGLGLRRQSPELRRWRDLAQAVIDPGDPLAFAPRYMLRTLTDENGVEVPPHALLDVTTAGDAVVPIAAGLGFARAAGVIPFLPPWAAERLPALADYATPRDLYERLGRRTPMRLLVETGVAAGVARAGGTTPAGPDCKPNYTTPSRTCAAPPAADPFACQTALYDPDWVSEGRLPWDPAHPSVPLRLARVARLRATDGTTLAASWEPRLRGLPFAPDESGWTSSERVVAHLTQFVEPRGAHTWTETDICRAWDHAAYGNALIARFFASGGRDVHYLSHPKTHGCLVDRTCDFFP